MAIYELLIRQSYYDQEVLNRFHFTKTSALPVDDASRLAQAVGATGLLAGDFPTDSFMRAIQDLVRPELSFLEVQAKNLYSETDFFTVAYNPPPVGKAAGSDSESPVLAMGFSSNRTTLAVRRGQKRFAGMDADYFDAGGHISAAGIAAATVVAAALSANQEVTDGLATWTYVPTVLAFQLYHPAPGKNAYKPYDDEATQLEHAAVGVTYSYKETVRTQRSRQYGRGR